MVIALAFVGLVLCGMAPSENRTDMLKRLREASRRVYLRNYPNSTGTSNAGGGGGVSSTTTTTVQPEPEAESEAQAEAEAESGSAAEA